MTPLPSAESLATTRRSMHGVAELLLAGPQKAATDTVRLRFAAGAIRPWAADLPALGMTGLEWDAGVARIEGTIATLADRAGITPATLTHVYRDGAGLVPESEIEVDEGAARLVLEGFAAGAAALADFAPEDEPVLWPEHFDLAIVQHEVNYGIVAGDATLAFPYAYVGPWAARLGPFWNVSFGAARPLSELSGAAGVADFFRQGCAHASSDPLA